MYEGEKEIAYWLIFCEVEDMLLELFSLSASPSGSSSSTFPKIFDSFSFFAATKALWMRKLEWRQ